MDYYNHDIFSNKRGNNYIERSYLPSFYFTNVTIKTGYADITRDTFPENIF